MAGHALRQALSQLWPEPAPVRPYVHPSQYVAPEHVRLYSDGMHKLYQPNLCTLAIAAVTLGLYIGVPHLLLGLLVASVWYRAALIALFALLLTLLLPARPLRIPATLSSYVFLCWRRYFKFSYLFEKSLDCYQDYVIAQFPHGAFPLGALLGGTFMATEYPEYHCYALAAASAFYVPVWRHVHAWLGTETCTKTNFHRLLSLGVKGPLPPLRRSSTSGGGAPALAVQQQEQQQQQQQQQGKQAGAAAAAAVAAAAAKQAPGGNAAGAAGALSGGLRQRRGSLSGSLRASFKQHHSLSDTESSSEDSDPEPASDSSPRPRRVSAAGSYGSSAADGESSAGSCASCSAPACACGAPAASAAAAAGRSGWRIDPATGQRKTGVSVGLMVGGIAEMFMIRRDHERIKLRDRKGFVRIALEHGVPILPVYMFGTNQVLDFGPPWLQRLSRRMRASVGMIYGAWGLPVPRRLPIFMVTGKPLDVGPAMRKDHPRFAERVDELHGQFIAEMERIYYTHRAKYGHGYEDRPLVIT